MIQYMICTMMSSKMNLSCNSYIRTHKQTITHCASITKVVVNIKKRYPNLYGKIIDKVEKKYIQNLIEARH